MVKATNAQITQLAPVLNSPTVSSGWSQGSGTTAMVKWATGGKASKKKCNSNKRKKKKNCKKKAKEGKKAAQKKCGSGKNCKKGKRHLYVFAGSEGSPVQGRFSLPCVGDAKAAVVGENRTVPVRNGSFSDHFADGNAIHIYRVAAGSRCGLRKRPPTPLPAADQISAPPPPSPPPGPHPPPPPPPPQGAAGLRLYHCFAAAFPCGARRCCLRRDPFVAVPSIGALLVLFLAGLSPFRMPVACGTALDRISLLSPSLGRLRSLRSARRVSSASAAEMASEQQDRADREHADERPELAGHLLRRAVGGHHALRLDHVVGVHALRRLHAVELASKRGAHQLGGLHGAFRCGAHPGDLHDQARVAELQVGRHRVTGIRALPSPMPGAPYRCSGCWTSRLTITDWSEKRVYGLSGLMRPSAGSRAISSAVGGGGGLIRT